MTIEQAKILSRLPLEDLRVIEPERAKFYKLIAAYSNGATIQYYSELDGEWQDTAFPFFTGDESVYRIKPTTAEDESTSAKVDGIELSADEVQIIRLIRKQRIEEIF